MQTTTTSELLNDITKYVSSLKNEKKMPTQKVVKTALSNLFEKHTHLFTKKPNVNFDTDKKTTGFQLMCAHKQSEIQSGATFVVNKTLMKLACSYLWGRDSKKLSNNAEISKLNLSPLSSEDKSNFIKLARKMNKKFKSTKPSNSSQKNPYLKMCKDMRPRLAKIKGLQNKDFMKIFGWMWKEGVYKEGTSNEIKEIVKKNKLKPLTSKDKKKYM